MVTYIYFVKCPNCEDEHFDFFDDAKGFAMGCLSKKPIITQTEVCRNDFGECTDHCDLGTVWSWEDVVNKETEESGTNVFSKGDFGEYDPDNDPEFTDKDDDFRLINSLDEAVTAGISFKNSEDFAEFKKLCDEIGIVTMGDVKNFMQENDANDANIIDKLKEYRKELGPDFKIKESKTLTEKHDVTKDSFKAEVDKALEDGERLLVFYGNPCEIGIRSRDYYVEEGYENEYAITYEDYTYMDDFTGIEEVEGFDSYDELWDCLVSWAKSSGFSSDFASDYNFISEPLTEDTNVKTWSCWYDNRVIGTVEASDEEEAAEKMMSEYPEYVYDSFDHDFYVEEAVEESCKRKPVPEGMTVEQLVETMEENEDEVECTWCNDLFPKDMCKKEVNLGYLCPRCADGIMSRGETLTFKENNYWDFLDEKFDIDFEDEASSDMLDATSDAEADEFVEFDLDYPEID